MSPALQTNQNVHPDTPENDNDQFQSQSRTSPLHKLRVLVMVRKF